MEIQMSHILAFAGSARKESFNQKLVKVAAGGAAEAGAQVTVADLRDYPMPIFCEDLEAEHGIPESALAFRELLKAADGLLIASPEYNSSFSALLKNTVDWATRPHEGEQPLECFKGKTAALVAASPGYFGGYRGLQQLRYLLGNIGVVVLPEMFTLPGAHEAFAADGSLKDDKQTQRARAVGESLDTHLSR
jgi:chromate reductase, NAD(P)H dehydrogenase (quinone)